MTQFHYPLPSESEPTSSFSGLSDEARLALTRVAMGPSPADQLLGPDGQPTAELDPDFQDAATKAHDRLYELLIDTAATVTEPVLNSPEFANVDWSRLQEGYRAYEKLNMQPELVISPEGQPLGFWKILYSRLRDWQDRENPQASHRLKNKSDGDGLFVNEEVAANWDSLVIPAFPGWKVSVIPTTVKPPVLNVDHKGVSSNNALPKELHSILSVLPTSTEGGSLIHHPIIEAYLTLQATRLHTDQPPVDDKVDGVYYWSWLDGIFTNSSNNRSAPRGLWIPDIGQVRLGWGEVGDRRGSLGARPEVRG